jgi:SAM-dependent methyltransferase
MPQYGEKEYWDTRYSQQKEKTFDWLENWEALKPVVEKLITPESRILMLGWGNALISQEMYDDGYEHITNMDISPVVIEDMKERNLDRQNMVWEVMDVMSMEYKDESFDIAIDKSTIDALLWGNN